MNQEKYIGMDVHDATISAAVKNAQGKLLMECVLETKAATILEFIQGPSCIPCPRFWVGTCARGFLSPLCAPAGMSQSPQPQNQPSPSRRSKATAVLSVRTRRSSARPCFQAMG